MAALDLRKLGPWDSASGELNAIIETSKGSRNKFKYEPETGSFLLNKVLPRGMVFPFDFGFIPATVGEDGDPLDVLVLMEEPAFAGCRILCRLVGVLEAVQVEKGHEERNDRLIAVAWENHEQKDVKSLKDLSPRLLEEIEHFFATYHDLDDKEFKPLGRHGPHRAEKLVREAAKRQQKGNKE